jgi:hypothetical protein
MTMPKTAVNEDYRAMLPKNDIGSAGQPFRVQTETETHSVKEPPNRQLGAGVGPLYTRHVSTASRWREPIHTSLHLPSTQQVRFR